ncbi:MAG: PAS domain S-box protein, partial [Cyanobacteria bacterium P01_H01_bin.58]
VFAARAAAELERQRVTTSLEQLNQALETKVKERTRELTLTQTAVELAADAVFMIRRDSSFYYVNKAACQMLGHSREELLTLSVLDIDPNFTPETWPQHWQEAQQNYLLTIETQHQHQDGHLYPVEVNINYLELYGEELLFSCARDISDRKQAEVALRASEARLQLITDSVHGCIAYIDAEERYQFVNRTYEEWFDCQQNDLLGHTIESVIGTVAYQQIQQHVKHVLSGQTVTYEAEVPYQRGPTRYVSGFLVPDINPQGQVSGYYALITDISDRRRAELALQKSQHFIEQIANASPNILYLYDLQTSCNVYANRAIATTLGYSAEAVQAMGNDVLPALMHPDDFKQYAHHCERLKTAQDNEIFEFEYRMRHVNGQWLWLCSRDAVFNRDGQGQVQQIIGSAQDISDRKYTEETLRRSEATNRVLIEAIPDFLIRMRTDGTELEVVNARTVHCLYPGATPESIHGLSIIETMPTAIAQERIHLAKTALATGNMQRQEYSFLDQGQTYYEEARIMPLWKDEVLVVVRDITERKQAERIFHGQAAREKLLREVGQRIRESLDLQTIFETACQEIRTVLQADRVGIFRFYPSSSFNKGEFVAESVVAELGSVIGIPVKDHCFGENYASLYTQGKYLVADDILQNQLTPCHADILKKFAVRACMVFPLLCGEQLWGLLCVHQCTTVRHWHQSEIDFIQQLANQIAIAIQQANLYEQLQQELLERQQAQQQLTERNQQLAISNKNLASATRLKDEFLANMSHEIRTPMNAIIGMTHLTLETALTPKQQNYLAKIDKSAHALLRIINDILDFSKIEAGKLTLECVAFSLDEVLINLADSTHFKAINKELELVFEMGPNVPSHLCGDPLRLGQVLLNLVSNAIKFTRSGYVRVAISTLTQSDRTTTLKFTVQDTGIGLSPQQKEHLFQAFSQGDASTTRRYGGTGLGLAITKKLVTLMQGELGVHSIPDEGSTFWFTVPFKGAKFTRQPPVAADIAPLVGKRMLVIEENPATSSILMSLLQGLRLQAEVVDSGSAALTALAAANRSQHPYDSILMDYVMADMDGLSFMRHLHQDTHLAAIPTIMMVAPHQYRQAQQELQPLDVTLLRKPISALTLLEQLVPVFTGEHRCAATQLQVGSSSPDIVRSQQHSWQGLRILLVEDNALNQELTVAFLTRAQAMVTVANNGQEALEKLTANTYDAVLMDCQMPVMDGYEATRRIRSVLKQTALPIIAMTAHAMPRDRAKCLAVGMNDYLAKPINWADLANVLQRWIAPHISPTDQPLRSALVASAARQDIIDLAMLKHFDVEIGLDYVGHDDNLYRSLLHKFLAKQSNFITTIEKQLQAGDLTSAIRTTHTLKGISGTLGCKVLQARASTLEVELCGSTAPSITVALAQVRESLEAVMTELSRWAATQTRSTTLLPPTIQIPSLVNGPSLLTTIESTIHLLETDWVAAMEKVTLLKNTLQGRTDTRSLLVSIDSALDHFDTEQAKTGLEQLMQYVEAQL